MRFIKPLDEAMVRQLAAQHELLITLEDNAVQGGAGSAVSECLAAQGMATPIIHLGLPDEFLDQGSRAELLALCGLDAAGILRAVRGHFETQRQAAPVQVK